MQYVMKLGAYGLAGVAAFAVAVALMLSASSTPTAEAASEAATTNGGKVTFGEALDTNNVVEFVKILDSSTSSGSFTHKTASADGQTVLCQQEAPCDVSDTSNVGPLVELKVDVDSPAGFIIVQMTAIGIGGATTIDAVSVTRAAVPTRIAVKAAESIPAAGGITVITVRVEDEKGADISEAAIDVVTTNGTLNEAKTTTAAIGNAVAMDDHDEACACRQGPVVSAHDGYRRRQGDPERKRPARDRHGHVSSVAI